MLGQNIKRFVFLRDVSRVVTLWSSIQHATGIASNNSAMFHTCICQFGTNKLMKMLKGERSKKQWYDTPPKRPPSNYGILKTSKKRSTEDNARLRMLNSILFKEISNLLGSHEVSPDLPHFNVEISKVSLSPDYSACRVYWKTCGTSERDTQIQKLLDKSAPRIRYLLTSLQILGGVPAIVFIRDKQYAALNEIDDLLKVADFGPDEVSIETANVKEDRVKSHLTVYANELEQQPSTKRRPVLFGFDHDALLKQLQDYKQTIRDSPALPPSAALTQQQLDAFAEFRKQKQIEKKRKKSKKVFDNDITPKAYLLAKHSEQRPLEDEDDDRHEHNQISELMDEDRRMT